MFKDQINFFLFWLLAVQLIMSELIGVDLVWFFRTDRIWFPPNQKGKISYSCMFLVSKITVAEFWSESRQNSIDFLIKVIVEKEFSYSLLNGFMIAELTKLGLLLPNSLFMCGLNSKCCEVWKCPSIRITSYLNNFSFYQTNPISLFVWIQKHQISTQNTMIFQNCNNIINVMYMCS